MVVFGLNWEDDLNYDFYPNPPYASWILGVWFIYYYKVYIVVLVEYYGIC